MQNNSNAIALRTTALEQSNQKVGNMVGQIVKAFDKRDAFEKEQGLNLDAENSYTRERNNMLAAKHDVARLFLALGVKPSNVILRSVNKNSMFNAKALKKVREIAQFVCGNSKNADKPLEMVTASFIACAIVAHDNGQAKVQNVLNKEFVTSRALDYIKDEKLRDAIQAIRADIRGSKGSVSGGRDTQSSQVRNVLDVLDLGEISETKRSRDTIAIYRRHAFFELFEARYMQAQETETAESTTEA